MYTWTILHSYTSLDTSPVARCTFWRRGSSSAGGTGSGAAGPAGAAGARCGMAQRRACRMCHPCTELHLLSEGACRFPCTGAAQRQLCRHARCRCRARRRRAARRGRSPLLPGPMQGPARPSTPSHTSLTPSHSVCCAVGARHEAQGGPAAAGPAGGRATGGGRWRRQLRASRALPPA